MQAEQVPFKSTAVRAATFDESDQTVGAIGHLAVAHQGTEERRALPQVVAVDLRHRGAEALADPVLQRLDQLPLPLQVLNLAEMQANLDQLDERRHGPTPAS